MFDRKIFFDTVRPLFGGGLSQEQVDGMNAILQEWEQAPLSDDLRHLAYPLATTMHETASTMQPIEEYGKGKGQPYGVPDHRTGQTYYGRGYVQLTWYENYRKASLKLHLSGSASLVDHPGNALLPNIAAEVMFIGMREGWFRSDTEGPQTLGRYFNSDTDDAYRAREIINGDKSRVPTWSGGVSIGKLIAGYHAHFLTALRASYRAPGPEPGSSDVVVVLTVPDGVKVRIVVNGKELM